MAIPVGEPLSLLDFYTVPKQSLLITFRSSPSKFTLLLFFLPDTYGAKKENAADMVLDSQ
jgi:hypothetical protein